MPLYSYPPEETSELDDPLRGWPPRDMRWEEIRRVAIWFIHGIFDIITLSRDAMVSESCPARDTDFLNFIYMKCRLKIITGDGGVSLFRANVNP